jgi:hypothetical protein
MKLTLILFFGAALACPGTTIRIGFDSSNQFANAGSTITYSANLFNLTPSDIDLGSASVSLGGNAIVDTSVFLNGPAVLPASISTGSFTIFTVRLPSGTPTGSLFPGILSITDLNDNILGEAQFSIATVSEPCPVALGVLALLLWIVSIVKGRIKGWLHKNKPFTVRGGYVESAIHKDLSRAMQAVARTARSLHHRALTRFPLVSRNFVQYDVLQDQNLG